MTNEKREQARILREIGEGWKANGITTGVDACLNGAAALMREAEAATAPDVSEAELAEWDALCEKATSGPWNSKHHGVFDEDGAPVAQVSSTRGKYEWEENNRNLIAASRTALPRLITALRAARQQIADERSKGLSFTVKNIALAKREQTAVGLLRRVRYAGGVKEVKDIPTYKEVDAFLAALEARVLPTPGMSMPPETQALSDALDKWAEDSRNNPQRIGVIEARGKEVGG